MALVKLIRERVEAWRAEGFPGVTRTTLELLRYWNREGREKRLFYLSPRADRRSSPGFCGSSLSVTVRYPLINLDGKRTAISKGPSRAINSLLRLKPATAPSG